MRMTETSTTIQTNTTYTTTQPLAFQIRNSIIEWLFRIHKKLEGDNITLFKTIHLLDAYLNKEQSRLSKKDIELSSAVCLFICYKLEEVACFDLQFLQKLLSFKFSKEEIIQTEFRILKLLLFRVNIKSIQCYSNEFVCIISNDLKDVYNECSYFVNLITLLVDELVFKYDLERLSSITFITTIKLLVSRFKISEQYFGKVLKLVTLEDLKIAELLYELVNEQYGNSIFFTLVK